MKDKDCFCRIERDRLIDICPVSEHEHDGMDELEKLPLSAQGPHPASTTTTHSLRVLCWATTGVCLAATEDWVSSRL